MLWKDAQTDFEIHLEMIGFCIKGREIYVSLLVYFSFLFEVSSSDSVNAIIVTFSNQNHCDQVFLNSISMNNPLFSLDPYTNEERPTSQDLPSSRASTQCSRLKRGIQSTSNPLASITA